MRRTGTGDLRGRVNCAGGRDAIKSDGSTCQIGAGNDHARAASRWARVGDDTTNGRSGNVGEAARRGSRTAKCGDDHIHRAGSVRRTGTGDLRGRVNRAGGGSTVKGKDSRAGKGCSSNDHTRAASLWAGVGDDTVDGRGGDGYIGEAAWINRRAAWVDDRYIHNAGRIRRGGEGNVRVIHDGE